MRARIGLFLGTTPRMGGVFGHSHLMLQAIAALPRERFDPIVATSVEMWMDLARKAGPLCYRIHGRAWSLLCGWWLTWSGIPVPAWWRLALAVDPLARGLTRYRCDLWVFCAHSFVAYQMPVRAVGLVHDLMHRYEPRFRRDFGLAGILWRERVFRRLTRYCTAVFTDSELGRRHVLESYGADPRRVWALPFVATLDPATGSPPGFEERYRLPRKYLFYPAEFWAHKNHVGLLRAVARLRDELPDLALVLSGHPHREYRTCVRLAHRLGLSSCVRFLGYVPREDLPELYRRARALVYPSFFGPTNLPPLEAFALGCPVAAANVYAASEQTGDAALLFDPTSEASMVEAIRRIWTDDNLCRELARRGLERHRRWGVDAFAKRVEEIVSQILSSECETTPDMDFGSA